MQRSHIWISVTTFFILIGALAAGFLYIGHLDAVGRLSDLALPGKTLPESLPLYALMAGSALAVLIALTLFFLLGARRRAEHLAGRMTSDLMSSRELFVKLYRDSPLPYMLLSAESKITFPNRAALRLFGVTMRELDGTRLFDVIEDGDDEHTMLLEERFRRGSPIHEEEIKIRRPDGTINWVLLSILLFQQNHGKEERNSLATLVDITKQKEIERAKTEFVSLASHQLRTPISSIKWHTELLASPRKGELTGAQKEELVIVQRGIERMNTVVSDFLNVARLELGTLKADLETVDIEALVTSILEDLSALTHEKSIRVETSFDSTHMRSNPRLLRMVLENLVSNAVKYTPSGGSVRIRVALRDGKVEIAIADTGYGIPEDEQGKLFTKLFRATNIQGKADGTGFGLYIVRLALDVLGGSVRFESKQDQGTTFWVTLPG